jgi:predicted ABC-type transport system involved in lysophospholipase L1 biosynthesis ATPase subunit
MVTHDRDIAARATRTVHLSDGVITDALDLVQRREMFYV